MRTNSKRRGAAAVELAVCLPVMVVLVLGTIECTSMIFVEQSLHIVAYETARTAIRPTAQNTEVHARWNQVVTERKLNGVTVQITPSDIENLPEGTPITVTATAPAADNSVFPLQFFTGNLQAVTVMNKE